jgi:hypothetical protein
MEGNSLKIKKFLQKKIWVLFFLTFAFHLFVSFFLNFFNFYPYQIPDANFYHTTALELSKRWKNGVFSWNDIYISNWYPYFLAFFYTIIFPSKITGVFIASILAGLSALFLYRLMKEVGAEEKIAIFSSFLFSNLYLSYNYFGNVLLKDTLLIPLILFILLMAFSIIKKFSFLNTFFFILFFLFLYQLRWPYALLLNFFFIFFPFFTNRSFSQKFFYFLFFFFLFFFLPFLSKGGFCGIGFIKPHNPEKIVYLRQVGYSIGNSSLNLSFKNKNQVSKNNHSFFLSWFYFFFSKDNFQNFLIYLYNFLTVLIGPFPWQLKIRYLPVLFEAIPWWFCFAIILFGLFKNLKKKETLFIFFLALGFCFLISLLSDNLGANLRYRMPAFFLLFSIFPLGLKEILKKFKKLPEV